MDKGFATKSLCDMTSICILLGPSDIVAKLSDPDFSIWGIY